MTARELLYSVDGMVRLEVKTGISTLTIKSLNGGTSIVDTVFRFSGLDSEILNAPARIKDPVGDFTSVVVDMEEFNRTKGKEK